MPRKYTRKTKRKSRMRRRTKRFSQGVPSGMPTQRRATLRYATQSTLTSTSGTMSSHLFRANSVFDPDYTSTGHQPMGFDQWASLFNHYVVVGAKITCTVLSDNVTASPFVIGVYLSDDIGLPYTNWYGFKEARKGTQRFFNGGAQNTRAQTVSSFYGAKKFYNIKDIRDNFDRIGSLNTGNPSDGAYFVVYHQQVNSTSDAKNIMVTIDYIVDFSEPKNLAIS